MAAHPVEKEEKDRKKKTFKGIRESCHTGFDVYRKKPSAFLSRCRFELRIPDKPTGLK